MPTYCKAVGCGASLCRECFTQHVLELTPSGNKPVSRLGHSNAGRKQIHQTDLAILEHKNRNFLYFLNKTIVDTLLVFLRCHSSG